jgi:hypothetical protein
METMVITLNEGTIFAKLKSGGSNVGYKRIPE